MSVNRSLRGFALQSENLLTTSPALKGDRGLRQSDPDQARGEFSWVRYKGGIETRNHYDEH